uniref:Larval cuticle protein 16/17 n=1 Tax=Lygus hesperus TaxID=30085 RepID=A0A0A9XAJ2_LYGHE
MSAQLPLKSRRQLRCHEWMMVRLIFLATLLSGVASQMTSGDSAPDSTVNYNFTVPEGSENTSLPKGKRGVVTRGKYSYTGPDGKTVTTNWYVDETGFHVEDNQSTTTEAPKTS